MLLPELGPVKLMVTDEGLSVPGVAGTTKAWFVGTTAPASGDWGGLVGGGREERVPALLAPNIEHL